MSETLESLAQRVARICDEFRKAVDDKPYEEGFLQRLVNEHAADSSLPDEIAGIEIEFLRKTNALYSDTGGLVHPGYAEYEAHHHEALKSYLKGLKLQITNDACGAACDAITRAAFQPKSGVA